MSAPEPRARGAAHAIIPRATYRIQFRDSFGFRQATAIAPYLKRLGVSHVYASPYFKARPGSSHGYDIVDHHALNPELGSEEDFADNPMMAFAPWAAVCLLIWISSVWLILQPMEMRATLMSG